MADAKFPYWHDRPTGSFRNAGCQPHSGVKYTVKASPPAVAGAGPGRSSNWHHSIFSELVGWMLVATMCLSPAQSAGRGVSQPYRNFAGAFETDEAPSRR
jgi:hypothetical protein